MELVGLGVLPKRPVPVTTEGVPEKETEPVTELVAEILVVGVPVPVFVSAAVLDPAVPVT